ncbi:DUF397 domain-containing protein [Paractinoplanes rishiriensis]|uniref:DUF397 domain-containing protein n=1 Tax=Paractinoplanes rishiriensis TaxID=1050105 RepID=A0A919JUP1_9ACTN|nr:DUF397 domain-containing protein [Actinoplanes rishiriensis]GIE95130.1 hypothetical protein Ari01nite_25950 [Actinoplanes rishiriensis]
MNDQEWTRSSYCADNACVEVAVLDDDRVAMRDSKNRDSEPIIFTRPDWAGFLAWIEEGTLVAFKIDNCLPV